MSGVMWGMGWDMQRIAFWTHTSESFQRDRWAGGDYLYFVSGRVLVR